MFRHKNTHPRTTRRIHPPTKPSIHQRTQPNHNSNSSTAVRTAANDRHERTHPGTKRPTHPPTRPNSAPAHRPTRPTPENRATSQPRKHSPRYETTHPPTQRPTHPLISPSTLRTTQPTCATAVQEYVQQQKPWYETTHPTTRLPTHPPTNPSTFRTTQPPCATAVQQHVQQQTDWCVWFVLVMGFPPTRHAPATQCTHNPPTNPIQQCSSAATRTAAYRHARSSWSVLEGATHQAPTTPPATNPTQQYNNNATVRIDQSTMAVQQSSSTHHSSKFGTRLAGRDLHFFTFFAFPGRERAVPGRAFSRSPLAELETASRYVVGDTEG